MSLGRFLGALGRLLAGLKRLWGASWLARTLPGSILDVLGLDFVPVGVRFWTSKCLSLHHVDFDRLGRGQGWVLVNFEGTFQQVFLHAVAGSMRTSARFT